MRENNLNLDSLRYITLGEISESDYYAVLDYVNNKEKYFRIVDLDGIQQHHKTCGHTHSNIKIGPTVVPDSEERKQIQAFKDLIDFIADLKK